MSILGLALSVLVGVSLAFFGGGGSILTVPLLVYVFGLDPKQAIASSLLIIAAASVSGALQHWRKGNVALRTGALFGAAGMAGAYAGGRIGSHMNGTLLLLLFASMMILTAMAMWRGRGSMAEAPAAGHARGRLVGQGLCVGLFTGLVGVGGGFLIVSALVLWAGLPMATAVGTSLVIIVFNTLAGFAGHAGHVSIDAPLVAAVGAMAVGGSFVGAWLAQRIDSGSLRRLFSVFIIAMAILILVRESAVWVATVRTALPASVPQIIFALIMLGVGMAVGRVSLRSGGPATPAHYKDGSGI